MRLKTLDDVPYAGKRVLLRVDFNVPVGSDGAVGEFEDYRIEAALATIQELRQGRCKIILLTHLGRPQEASEQGVTFAVDPIRRRLEELTLEEIRQAKHLFGNEIDAIVQSLEPGGMVLLPNVRLDEREEQGNTKFAEQLAGSADLFVNEAFSVCHRAHTSVAFVPQFLPACAGRRVVAEYEALQRLRDTPAHPYIAIVSGAKVSTKVGMLRGLLQQVDTLCLGGQIANTFLAVRYGWSTDQFHPNDVAAASSLLEQHDKQIVLPRDVVIGEADGSGLQTLVPAEVPAEARVYDIGPASVSEFVAKCTEAQTIMWNGPVGMVEVAAYAVGTDRLAQALAELSAYRVVGGGDTLAALERLRLADSFNHMSVAGGALIAFLEGKRLPGLEPLFTE